MTHKERILQSSTEMTALPDAWERQPNETHRAYMAFCVYRDLGPLRALRKAAAGFYGTELPRKWGESGRFPTQVERWSSRYRWVTRASAYDAYLDHERRGAHLEAIREMEARHIQIALQMQAKAMEALAVLDPHDLSPADILRFIKEGTKLERLARGVGIAKGGVEPNHEGHSSVQPTLNQLPAEDPRKVLIESLLSVVAHREAQVESVKRVTEIPSTVADTSPVVLLDRG